MSFLKSALAYAKLRGWSVFPIAPKGKNPLTPHGYKDATRDLEQIEEWWTEWPKANIGIPTGKENELFVLDVDTKNNGHDTLYGLIMEHGELPHTIQAKTGGGGSHFLFQYEEGIKNKTEFKQGLDIRGDGGYIVVSPSLHESGKRYEWVEGHHPLDTRLSLAPLYIFHTFANFTYLEVSCTVHF